MSNIVTRINQGGQRARHIILKGLPLSVTSGDLRRAVMLAGLQGVTDISLDYRRFRFTRKGVLTLSAPDYTQKAFQAAKEITFTGSEKITAEVASNPTTIHRQRLRGIKGRAEALKRGLLGHGPNAGGFPAGKTVTIVGFPGKFPIENLLLNYLRGFQLASDELNSVIQVPLPVSAAFSMLARFVVMLESESEAQRLVRKLHHTPHTHGGFTRYITADVLY